MSKVPASHIETRFGKEDALTARNIYYAPNRTIKEALDEIRKIAVMSHQKKPCSEVYEHYSNEGQTRIVEGTLLDRNSNAGLAHRFIYFKHRGVGISVTGVYPSGIITARTDINGFFQIALAVPNGISEPYTVTLPAGDTYHITITSGKGKISLSDLLRAGVLAQSGTYIDASNFHLEEAFMRIDDRLRIVESQLRGLNG